MTRTALSLTPALALLAACAVDPDGADGSGTQSTGDATATADETGTGDGDGDGDGDTGTTGDTCTDKACAGSSEDYCYPCNPESAEPEPWLTLGGSSGFADGGAMKVVCGGQGSWMFEIHPSFGGFTLAGASVAVDYEVRVEDFNINDGMFASGTRSIPMLCCDTTEPYDYESGLYGCNQNYLGSCYSYSGGLRVFRFFPPDVIPELTDLDGKAVEIDITLHAGAKGPQEFHFEGTVSSTAPWEDCEFGDAVPDPAGELDDEAFDWSSHNGIPT